MAELLLTHDSVSVPYSRLHTNPGFPEIFNKLTWALSLGICSPIFFQLVQYIPLFRATKLNSYTFFRSGEAGLNPLEHHRLSASRPLQFCHCGGHPWLEDKGWNSEVTPSRSIVALSNNGDIQSVTMTQI